MPKKAARKVGKKKVSVVALKPNDDIDLFIQRMPMDGVVLINRKRFWELIERVRAKAGEELNEHAAARREAESLAEQLREKMRQRGLKIADLYDSARRSANITNRVIKNLQADLKQQRLLYVEKKKEWIEERRRVAQRDKVIAALLMPWAAVLGPVYLETALQDLMGLARLQVDEGTLGEIQILMNEHIEELLGRPSLERRKIGDPVGNLEILKQVATEFRSLTQAWFPAPPSSQ